LKQVASGSATPIINKSLLAKYEFFVPPLVEQRAIAQVLGALDDKIAANAKLAQSLSGLTEACFASVSQWAAGSWETLADLVETQYGVTVSASAIEGPRLLRVTDINKRPWIEWNGAPGCRISDSDWKKYRLSAGDILVARMADPGKAAFIDEGDPDAVFASYLVRLKATDPTQAMYIYYFMRSGAYQKYAEGVMTGSVQKNMNARIIVGAEVSMPDRGALLEFNTTVRALRGSLRSTLVENMHLSAIRDSLLPPLMSGKIRVRDAEKAVEEVL